MRIVRDGAAATSRATLSFTFTMQAVGAEATYCVVSNLNGANEAARCRRPEKSLY